MRRRRPHGPLDLLGHADKRRLPAWLTGGPEVSGLAYQVVEVGLGAPVSADPEGVTVAAVVEHLVAELGVDEGDVLRAFAELKRAGVIV